MSDNYPPEVMPDAANNPQWAAFQALRSEIAKAVVGQDAAVTGLLIGLLCNGHVLLEGVPGTAKTLLVRALAAAVNLNNKRVQFTPDLMPGDLTGSLIYNANLGEFTFRPGPVFTNLLLADEINRTPPKTQAALLEAMNERKVSVDGTQRELPDPFMVVATQNPVEYEGTYSLPEAQLDRFMLKIIMDLPPREVEYEVLRRHTTTFNPMDIASANISPVADAQTILAARQQVAGLVTHPEVLNYVVDLVQATRQAPAVELGVSPRGAVALLYTARAWAWLNGRDFVTPDDVKSLAIPTLAHRIKLRSEAELDGVKVTSVIENILQTVAVPR